MTQPDERVTPDELVTFVTTDIAAITRGRAIAATDLPHSLSKGVGWVPANLSLTPFDSIASPNPFGSLGDLRLMPDPGAGVRVEGLRDRTPLHFYHSDITTLDGSPWECCVRSMLKSAVVDLERHGLRVIAAFEHEFQILRASWPCAPSFSLSAQRRADPFGPLLMTALRAAGCAPECFLPEYGRDQFEIVCGPAEAVAAADRAVTIREITREVAATMGWRASFCPKITPDGVGNGVHIHFSLTDLQGTPVSFDAARPGRLSACGGAFCAGIVRHMAALSAFTAPSVVSYQRLRPHTWSASWAMLGEKDREVALRICPTSDHDPSRTFNVEFRAADATASPHLSLALLIRAGIEGVKAGLDTPPIVRGNPEAMTAQDRMRRLPTSLPEALAALEADSVVCDWMTPTFLACWQGMRKEEMKTVAGLDAAALCRRYAEVY